MAGITLCQWNPLKEKTFLVYMFSSMIIAVRALISKFDYLHEFSGWPNLPIHVFTFSW